MTEQDRIIGAIRIAQKATFLTKIMPFVLVFCYIVCLIAYMIVSDDVQSVFDSLFYVSPVVVAFELLFSKTFKLCKWHRLECILPLIPQFVIIVDSIHTLSEFAAGLNVAVVFVMFVLSLINAYYTFIKK